MQHDRPSPAHLKLMAAACLVGVATLVASCTTSRMPKGAIDELNARWQSLPGSATYELTILRAWPGRLPSGDEVSFAPSMEVWCVDTVLSPHEGISADSNSMIWFVTRSSEEARWESAPLMTLSSTWPYEACQADSP